MSEDVAFGEFIRSKREAKGKTLRGFAAELDIAPAYMSDIEKGNRNPPEKHLEKMIGILELSGEELNKFYDLVGKERRGISPDISDYVFKNEIARVALRCARDNNITAKQWQEFIDKIKKEKQ